AFLQQTGRIDQFVSLAAGTYQLSFQAAQRGNSQASRQDFRVLVDGRVVGTFTPGSTAYAGFTTGAFSVAAGAGPTISFRGLGTAGGNNPAFADNAQITAVPPAATEFALPTANSVPQGIARGPDGNLWFTEFTSNRIGRITPAGQVTEFSQGL